MKLHYFQRYHSKENVDTANTMLLLSRLYSYDTNKFFKFLSNLLPENLNVGLSFNLQENNGCSIPDATIEQNSFKIVVETKLYSNFGIEQLLCHLNSFNNEDYKVLLTLDPSAINSKLEDELHKGINKYNSENNTNIIHKHLTFSNLIAYIQEVIEDRDYELKAIIEDYQDYCYSEQLIPDDWKRMRVQLAGTTLKLNKQLNLYYDNADRGFSGHKYIGLYDQKAVRAIGEIVAIATAIYKNEEMIVDVELGDLTDKMKENIKIAIEKSKEFGYNLANHRHRYFFVNNFYETNFQKITPYAPMGTRFFDLCELLEENNLPNTNEIAELLKQKTW